MRVTRGYAQGPWAKKKDNADVMQRKVAENRWTRVRIRSADTPTSNCSGLTDERTVCS